MCVLHEIARKPLAHTPKPSWEVCREGRERESETWRSHKAGSADIDRVRFVFADFFADDVAVVPRADEARSGTW